MTDLERMLVAWDLWQRRSGAVARGIAVWPLAGGAVIAGAMEAVHAIRQMIG